MKPNPTTLAEARDRFYNIMNMPLQSVCTVGKFFGGKWLAHCGAFDGNKYVCLDYFYGDVKSGNCLIYSFGVAGDWTFEEAMAGLGCTVRAFDPTIDGKQKPQNDLVNALLINFTYMFKSSFYMHRSQKHKMTDDFPVIFALLESTEVKGLHKTLMKLTVGLYVGFLY